ncbi:alpha/beta fold hydrolase [Telmatospirillum siberiense]|uniref:Alpha/beta hydrolase n=1 Tax=Telmatospirillum siberiense TaxID=382514 RepID=A0A2N3PWU6_9PROT|nr:alpha/beta fold hydrolase [Telmatospirillum siberiense]PKU24870.1 alpha/beta hydrolase [Telmatospirillum siberiense]
MTSVNLNAQIIGEGSPLVILHGLFGSARNWGSIARGLADIRQVHALDLRNHGSSPWDPLMSYERMAEDVAAYIERRGLAPADVLGHSMGGKTAMLMALTHPELVERLIVVDIAPVSYVRESFPEYLRAMQGIDLDRLHRRADIDEALAPAIPDASLRAFLMQNLVSQDGRFHWRINLAGIGPNLPTIIAFPEVEGHFDGPTTFLAGERSDYIRPRDTTAIERLFPRAKLIEIGETGHWPHAERPERFLSLTRDALTA